MDLQILELQKLTEQEEGIDQPSAETRTWICQQCTLENAWDNQACEVCESPKPVAASMQQPKPPQQ